MLLAMNKTWLIITGVVVALSAMGVAQFSFPRTAVSPAPVASKSLPVESNIATSSGTKVITANVPPRPVPTLPSIAKGDTIASWDFIGAYADNPELIAKANAEITRLLGLIGKGSYPDVSLYVAIANQYELLGDGKQQYDYLGRAIKVAGDTSGLPWHNLGVLMERLGALKTARAAYDKAALIQPQFKEIQQP